MPVYNATGGVDTLTADGQDDTFIFAPGTVQANDHFAAAGGVDRILLDVGPEPDSVVDYDFRPATVLGFESLQFSGGYNLPFSHIYVSFNHTQVGAEFSVIGRGAGGAGSGFLDIISVFLSPNASFSAAGWTFADWSDDSRPVVVGAEGAETITGSQVWDEIFGESGDDTIHGGGGNDRLDGGGGDDAMFGGDGDDYYVVESVGDVVSETSALGGIDSVASWITYTLPANIENLYLINVGAINGFGNGLDNVITGNDAANQLNGFDGNDNLDGGAGVDTSVHSLASASATWTRNVDGTWTVTGEGIDTLTNVEFLSFTDRDVFLDRAARTFSGNGTSDILFRRSDGIMASWEVTGATINAASFLPTAGAEWSVLGTGDISGDGRDDVIWQRDDGLVYSWIMDGGFSAAVGLTGIGPEWSFLGLGDFNGDLTDDLAWQRDDGVVFIWQMSNSEIQSANGVTGLAAEWQIAGFGDFNSDGRDDFLWRNANTGQTVIWQMNGSTITSPGPTSEQAGLDWAVVGVGDTNGDGRDDIVLQRASDGMISVWAMDGTSVMSATDVAAASPDQWTVRGIGDYNGDGRDDILWQHDNGLVYVWLMNGAAISSSGALSGIGPEWGII